jgi:hypothetical protein
MGMRRASPRPLPALGLTLALATLALATLGSCGGHARLDDDLDLAALRGMFSCGEPEAREGERREACRMLDALEGAGPLTARSSAGPEVWWGRKVCSSTLDDPKVVHFARLVLVPGRASPDLEAGVKLDPSKVLDVGAMLPFDVEHARTGPRLAGWEKLYEAARTGAEPALARVPGLPEVERARLEDQWRRVRRRPVALTKAHGVVQSKGASALVGPTSTGAPEGTPAAAYYLRQSGESVFVVYAHYKPEGQPIAPSWCVAELFRVGPLE